MRPEEYEISIREELQDFEPSRQLDRLVLMREKVVERCIKALLVAERARKEMQLLENMIEKEGNKMLEEKRIKVEAKYNGF